VQSTTGADSALQGQNAYRRLTRLRGLGVSSSRTVHHRQMRNLSRLICAPRIRQAVGCNLYATGPHVAHANEGKAMITTRNMKKMAGMALLSGGFGLAAVGMGVGTAQADPGPYHWCPGDSMQYPQPAPRSGGQAGPGLYYIAPQGNSSQ
jgi:hypothetical protein